MDYKISNEKKQIVNEIHKPARKKYLRRHIILKGIDDLWQVDLAELTRYSRENKGYKYLLVVLDCFSKYLWIESLKDKSASSVHDALRKIFVKHKRIPKNLQTDAGKEFYNHHFSDLMKKNNINHYSTYTIMKAAMVERVIRTIKEKMYKEFSERGHYKWIDFIEKITNEYNNKKHSKIKMKPSSVTKANESHILNNVYSHMKIAGKRKFNVGEIVRISKQKIVFDKGYTPNWTTELFKIIKIKITNPTTYLLEDMDGNPIKSAFYIEELQKAKYSSIYLVEKVLRYIQKV